MVTGGADPELERRPPVLERGEPPRHGEQVLDRVLQSGGDRELVEVAPPGTRQATLVRDRRVELVVSGPLLKNLWLSFVDLMLGFSLAVLIGVTIGLLIGRFRALDDLADGYLSIFLITPIVALWWADWAAPASVR